MEWGSIVALIGATGSILGIVGFAVARNKDMRDIGARHQRQETLEATVKELKDDVRSVERLQTEQKGELKEIIDDKLAAVEEKRAADYKELQAANHETNRMLERISTTMDTLVERVTGLATKFETHVEAGK